MADWLRKAGLSDKIIELLYDFLPTRRVIVAVRGHLSTESNIDGQEFQGTWLGPRLWNVLFKGVDL